MTKLGIVDVVHKKIGIPKKDVSKVVDDLFLIIKSEILHQQDVKISRFGNFEIKKRKQKMGRNLQTGEEAVIPPRLAVVFKPSKMFMDEVNLDQ